MTTYMLFIQAKQLSVCNTQGYLHFSPDPDIIIGIYIEIQILTIDYNACHGNVLIRIQLSEFSNKFLRFQNVYNESSRELKCFFLENSFFHIDFESAPFLTPYKMIEFLTFCQVF